MPHYSDYNKHIRRGDIVVSFPESTSAEISDDESQEFVYSHFEVQKNQLISKTWMPAAMDLYKIVNNIRRSYNPRLNKLFPWEEYLSQGIESLYNEELDCRRPVEDKLFFTVGEKNIIEVNHPEDQTGSSDRREYGQPTVRFGKIGGCQSIVREEGKRLIMSEKYGILCFDSDMDQVMESIVGNRKDSFILIRSIVDYVDGTTCKEWQPYAALCAAAFAKTIICALPAVQQFDYNN